MSRSRALASRLREVYLEGRWIANTNYSEQLSNTTWQQATLRLHGMNTIVALTYHVTYYLKGLSSALDTGKLEIQDKFSFDHPDIDSESAWDNLVADLQFHAEEFAARVETLQDEKLDEPFIEARYGTLLRNIEGVIEHSYYHLGQVTLIRKLIEQK